MYTTRSEMKILGANVVVGSAADASAAAVAAPTAQQQRDYRCSAQVKYNKYNNNNNNNGKSGNILRESKYSSNNNNNANNSDCKNAKRQQQQQQQQQHQHLNYNNNVHGFARKKYFGSNNNNNNNNNNYNCNQQQQQQQKQQQSPYYQQQQQQQVATSGAGKLSNNSNNNNNNLLIKNQNISKEANCKVSNDSNNNSISSKGDDSNNNNSSCNNNNNNNAVPKLQSKTNNCNNNNKNIVKKRNSVSSNTESSCSSGYYRSCSESSITQADTPTSSSSNSTNNNKEDDRHQQQQQQHQHSPSAIVKPAGATAAGEDKTTTKRKLSPTNGQQDNGNKAGQRSRQQPLCFWKTSYPQQPTMQQKEQQLEAALANQKETEMAMAAAAAKTAAAAAATSTASANAVEQQPHYYPHYYSQPKQLTIASFLQKDLLPEMDLVSIQQQPQQQQQQHQKQQHQQQQHSSQQQQQSGGYQHRYRNVNYNYNNNHYQHHNTHHHQHQQQQHQQQHQQQQQQHNHSNNHNHMHNQSFRRNKKMHFMSNTTPTQAATRSGTISSDNNYTSHRRVQQSAAASSGGVAGDGDDGGVAVAGKNGYYQMRQHQYYSPKTGKGQFVSADYQNFYNLTYVNMDAKQPVTAAEAQAGATVAGMQTLPSLLLKPLATGACAGPAISPPPVPIDAGQIAASATTATATTTVAATGGRNMFLQPPPTLQLLGPGMLSPIALTPDSVASTPTNMISCAQLDEAITAAAACNTSGSSSCNNNNNNSCSSSSSSNNIELGTVMTVPSPSYATLPFMLQHQQQQLQQQTQQQQLFFNNNVNAWGHPHSPCYSSGYIASGNNNNMLFHREVSPAPSTGSQSSESNWSRLTPTDLPPALSPTGTPTPTATGPQLSPHSLTPSLHLGSMNALHTILPFSIPPPLPHTHMGISLGNSTWQTSWYDAILPPDRYLDHARNVELTVQPEQLLCHRKHDNLSMDIWTRFCAAQQTQEKFKIKMRLWRYLFVWINQYAMQQPGLGRFRVILVGSTITGFGTDSSDIDMCLLPEHQTQQSQMHQQQHHYNSELRAEALMTLNIFHNFLKDLAFHEFNLIEARVPILRFKDRINGIEVDLNYNNCVGIKNTYLLQLYAQLDWRARPLVVVVKLWAQYHNINDAKRMTISSYSLVLMVLHYLQCGCVPHVLPCLQSLYPDKFNLGQQDCLDLDLIESIEPYQTHNKQTLGEHLLGFLKYYSNFDFRNNAISIRTGGILPVNACRLAKSPKNDIHQWKELNIEEPFDLSNTARSVYDYATFERVKGVFWNSARRLEQTLDLASIFTPIQHTQRVPMQQPSFFLHSQIPHHSNPNPNPHPYSHPPHAHQAQQQPAAQQPPPSTAETPSQTYPQLLQAARSTAIGATTTASKLINSGNFAPAASHVETGR